MIRPAMNQIATHGESYYSVVIGVAKRAREIAEEMKEGSDKFPEEKPVKIAVDEFAQHRYSILEDPSVRPGKSTDSTV